MYGNCAADILSDCLSDYFGLVEQDMDLLKASNLDPRLDALEHANCPTAEDITHGYLFDNSGRDGGRHPAGCPREL